MKLSLDWLSDFVDLTGLSADTVAEQLSLKTAEVEDVETVDRMVDGVRVVEVVSCEVVADEPVLHQVRLDLGDRTVTTFTAAANVRAGMRAAYAEAGCRLKSGPASSPTHQDFCGEGVLCSVSDLGMGAGHDLFELSPAVPIGDRLSEHVPSQDLLIDIDNKSLTHRPDLWGHYGFAREVAAIFERPLVAYPMADLLPYKDLPAVPIEVERFDECPVYTGFTFDVAGNPPSPPQVQGRLSALGHSSKNLLVDLSNYVQLELGQPNHTFDAETVKDGIRVARAGEIRTILTLDGNQWDLLPEDLLIFSGARPVALAGIMGGAETQVRDRTRRVLLECANFDGTRVRRTSARLGLRTDASLRFEKKLPPVLAWSAARRFFRLAQEWGADPTPIHAPTVVGDLRDRSRPLTLSPGYLSRAAGTTIEDETAAKILRGIGFDCEIRDSGELNVEIPAFRSETDISIPQDLAEEVMRLYGYDQIPPQLPIAPLEPAQIEHSMHGHHRQRRILSQAHGFVEVHSYGWHDDAWIARIGHQPERPLTLRNPPSAGKGKMRDSLVANLLEFAHANRKIREDFRIFELGKVFWADEENRSREENQLAGLSVCQTGSVEIPAHFREIRSVIDDLARVAALPALDYEVEHEGRRVWEVDGYLLNIRNGDDVVGTLGVLPSSLAEKVLNKGHLIWFALQPDKLAGTPIPGIAYQPIPLYPGSSQDFTLVWDQRQGYQALVDRLGEFEHPLIHRSELRGVFEPPQGDSANYTFRFHLRAQDRTLDSEDLSGFRAAMIAFLERASLTLS